MNCEKLVSYQSTTLKGNTKSLITEWNASSGEYGNVITLEPSMTDPPYRSINSCAVNPKKQHLYCAMQIEGKGAFLVKIDKDNIGFVDKLQEWSFGATFDENDNYYYYKEPDWRTGVVYVVEKVSTMDVWSNWSGLDAHPATKNADHKAMTLEDMMDGKKTKLGPQKYRLGADFAYINYTIDKTVDGKQEYLASLFGNELRLVRISPEPYAYWNLKVPNLPENKMPDGNTRVWGTAWSFRGSNASFFSADDGIGVWAMPAEFINLKTKKASANKVGPAVKTEWNDGISCGRFLQKKQDPCTYKMYRSTTENVNNKGGKAKSSIKVLHDKTGAVSDQGGWDVDEKDLVGINACAINPQDNIIYCHMQFKDGAWIARLDHKGTIGYLMKVEGWAIAGVFDLGGNYWFYYSGDKGLHMVGGEKTLKEFDAYLERTKKEPKEKVNLQQKQDTSMSNSKVFVNEMGADLALYVEEVIVEGLPTAKVYLVSILEDCRNDYQVQEFQSRVSFVEITGGKAQKAKILRTAELKDDNGGLPAPLPVNETPPNQNKGCQTWGSAWNLLQDNGKDELWFASDSGQGLFKLIPESINWECTTAPCVKFKKVGKADPISWNNGFSCRSQDPSGVVIGKPS